MTSRQEQIEHARQQLAVAEARHKELQEAADYLRTELPKAQQAVSALREKLTRLEAGDSVKQSRASELDWLQAQIKEATA